MAAAWLGGVAGGGVTSLRRRVRVDASATRPAAVGSICGSAPTRGVGVGSGLPPARGRASRLASRVRIWMVAEQPRLQVRSRIWA